MIGCDISTSFPLETLHGKEVAEMGVANYTCGIVKFICGDKNLLGNIILTPPPIHWGGGGIKRAEAHEYSTGDSQASL